MDWGSIIAALKGYIDYITNKFTQITAQWTELQWMLFGLGVLGTIFFVIQTLRAKRIAAYKLSTWGLKLSLLLIVLAFAWNYAVDLYSTALDIFDNPLYAAAAVFLGGLVGYNIVKLLLGRVSKQ